MPQLNRSIPPTLPERLSYSTEPGAGLSRDPGLWEWYLRADYFEKDFRREAAASEARLRAEQGQFLGHPNPNALRSSNIQHPVYRRKGTLRSGVSPMGFGV